VAEILNLLLTEMTDIIMRHEGMVDKFEGDAIIAIFGAPNFIENQAQKACEASIEMQKRMAELRQMWREKGRPELRMRIGMCTGQAIVGNMGSKDRMDYTMIGDTVNTAARLEGMNKMYGLYTLISETTLEEVGEAIQAREIDLISVVGKQKPVKIYEILGYSGQVNDQTLQAAALYKKGLEAYRSRQWESAIEYFEKTIAIQPGDGPSLTMIARCREFIMTPPDQGWEGVFVAKTK
jgi:adenylate cyclase